MHTINELLKLIDEKLLFINNELTKENLSLLKRELLNIKNAPELKGSCNIDFKLSNSDYYFQKINEIPKTSE